MKKLLLILLMIFSLNSYAQQGLITFEDKEAGFSIKHPKGWVVSKEPMTALVATRPDDNKSGGFKERISLIIDSTRSRTLNQYTQISLKRLSIGMPGFEQVSSDEVFVGGYKFNKVIYKQKSGDFILETVNYFTSKEGKIYNLSCTSSESSFSAYTPLFDEIVRSFLIL